MTKARDIADFKFENIVDTGTEGTKIASGSTGQRGSTTGQWRYNTTTNFFEGRNASGSFLTLEPTPTVTSVDDGEIDSGGGGNQTIVVTGTNFSSGGTVQTGAYYWYARAGVRTSDGADWRTYGRDIAFAYLNYNTANDGAGCSGFWFISTPETTDGYMMGNGVHGVDHNGGYFVGGAHSFGWRGNTAFNGIQLSVDNGTIGNGAKMSIYGMKES